MKVLLNCDAIKPPLTGIGHYALNLMQGMISNDEVDLYGFGRLNVFHLANADQVGGFNHDASMAVGGLLRRNLRRVPGLYALRSKIVKDFFQYQVKKNCDASIYHEPNCILLPFDGISLSTVHDLSWIHYPQYHPRERVLYMNREFPKTLDRADHFITDSEYVKNEMVATLGIASERITPIPLGVGKDFYPRTHQQLSSVLTRYKLKYKSYLLAVATFEPRKNLNGLLDAYMRLPERERRHLPLVLVGGKGWCSSTLEKRIQTLECSGCVRRLGYVSAADLFGVYAGAHSFVFPSHYEGFGLPPLEAMASGVPVLVSDNSAMSEVVGNAGIKVDAHDGEGIFSGLEQLLFDERGRKEMVASGLKRAREFSWESCVNKTFDVYQRMEA